MANAFISISHLFLASAILVFCTANVIKDKHHGHAHQAKAVTSHSRNSAQKCDLVCPGQPPLALPPNFLQNCSSATNNTSKTTQKPVSTTRKPSNSTTTESGEGGEEGGEGEEEVTEGGKNSTARGHTRHLKANKKKHQSLREHNSKKHHFRKQKMFLKSHARLELLKHKHLKGRKRLDDCYVVCSDQDKPGNAGSHGGDNEGGGDNDDDDEGDEEGESDSDSGDNYVEGEDTPIEIIYVPPRQGENRRPVDWYQTNNYAFVEPQPVFGVGFDPFFMEVKQQKIKKRKHKARKHEEKGNEKHK